MKTKTNKEIAKLMLLEYSKGQHMPMCNMLGRLNMFDKIDTNEYWLFFEFMNSIKSTSGIWFKSNRLESRRRFLRAVTNGASKWRLKLGVRLTYKIFLPWQDKM